ncbi:hypothetical protein OSTOST_03017 [Ostertagia ostertagi]
MGNSLSMKFDDADASAVPRSTVSSGSSTTDPVRSTQSTNASPATFNRYDWQFHNDPAPSTQLLNASPEARSTATIGSSTNDPASVNAINKCQCCAAFNGFEVAVPQLILYGQRNQRSYELAYPNDCIVKRTDKCQSEATFNRYDWQFHKRSCTVNAIIKCQCCAAFNGFVKWPVSTTDPVRSTQSTNASPEPRSTDTIGSSTNDPAPSTQLLNASAVPRSTVSSGSSTTDPVRSTQLTNASPEPRSTATIGSSTNDPAPSTQLINASAVPRSTVSSGSSTTDPVRSTQLTNASPEPRSTATIGSSTTDLVPSTHSEQNMTSK